MIFKANLSTLAFLSIILLSNLQATLAHAEACGFRTNLNTSPASANPTTEKILVGPGYAVLCQGSTWVPSSASVSSPSTRLVSSIGNGGFGDGTMLPVINVNNSASSGCTSPCVSTTTTAGGLDPGDLSGGRLQPNLLYNIYLVARDSSFAPNDWGLVFSSGAGRKGRSCTQGPSSTVTSVYPYYTCIDWFTTNGSANAMQYMTVKTDHVWQFAGGTGSGLSGTATLIEIAHGAYSQWTPIDLSAFNLDSNTGTFTVMVLSQTGGGTKVALAPNGHFGNFQPCLAMNGATQCNILPDQGYINIWSTDSAGFVFLVGGVSGF